MFGLGTRYLYPLAKSFDLITNKSGLKGEALEIQKVQWLSFWMITAAFLLVESFAATCLYFLPA
jgi:hypothetical protein